MKKLISLIILFSFIVIANSAYSSLTIDTNKLLSNNPSLTNLAIRNIVEPSMPNSYLASGVIRTEPPETPGRRYDVVFFVAIPVTFYLTLNILQLRNFYFMNDTLLDNADWNYIYLNTIFIPLVVAYFDHVYIDKQRKIKEELAYGGKIDYFTLRLPIYSIRF